MLAECRTMVLVELFQEVNVVDYYTSLANGLRYTCLSNTDENNMPMWAYYANNHQGFCVEYLQTLLLQIYYMSI